MSKWKKALFFVGGTLSCTSLFSLFTMKETFLLTFINSTFILSLFYCIVGGFLLVAESGFFNVTLYGFKKLFKSNNKKEVQLIEEHEGKETTHDLKERILYGRYQFSITRLFLYTGLSLTILTTIWSFYLI
ncbi:MAG: DUF3899 domain-containing protein [Bacillaceae bacterium]